MEYKVFYLYQYKETPIKDKKKEKWYQIKNILKLVKSCSKLKKIGKGMKNILKTPDKTLF